ncbi:MAG: tRNA pseudouridine(38-40) synthase TruA [Bacillota bacterium]
MKRVKVTVSYDGTEYSGWQVQKNTSETVQEKLEKVVNKFHNAPTRIIGASRTDAGVHAQGQVFHFDLKVNIPISRLPQAFNSELPDDIVCLKAEKVENNFHARFDAKRKKYIYKIDNNYYPDVFMRHYSYHIYQSLDIESMRSAIAYLAGEKDFSAFQAKGCKSNSSVREIYKAEIKTHNENTFYIEILGSGFLYNMMRIIVGTLIEIGKNKRFIEDMDRIIRSKSRDKAGFTAPAKGLTLEKIYY